MDTWIYWVIWLVFAVGGAYFASRIAGNKGHSPAVFGILGFALPLVGVIIAAVLPEKK